jgi:uncharacterized protein (DUF2062 family)
LRSQRSLRWLGPLLQRPWLWQINRRRVAAGVAIGVFFGFLTPILQIAFAAVFALLLRANLPVAAVSTLVSNPFTYAPIFVAAYKVGSWLLGEPVNPAQEAAIESGAMQAEALVAASWAERFAAIGKPFMLGLAVFAVIGGALAYFTTLLLWRLGIVMRLRSRRKRRRRAG